MFIDREAELKAIQPRIQGVMLAFTRVATETGEPMDKIHCHAIRG